MLICLYTCCATKALSNPRFIKFSSQLLAKYRVASATFPHNRVFLFVNSVSTCVKWADCFLQSLTSHLHLEFGLITPSLIYNIPRQTVVWVGKVSYIFKLIHFLNLIYVLTNFEYGLPSFLDIWGRHDINFTLLRDITLYIIVLFSVQYLYIL